MVQVYKADIEGFIYQHVRSYNNFDWLSDILKWKKII